MKAFNLMLISLFLITSSFTLSQTYVLKPNREAISFNKKNTREKLLYSKAERVFNKDIKNFNKSNHTLETLDTLHYSDLAPFNTNFGFFGGDVMMQFFHAPADLIIKGVGFSCADDSGVVNGADISVRLINLNWTYEQMNSLTEDRFMGHYPLAGDYFGENSTGIWIDSTNGKYPLPPWTNHANPDSNTWDYNLWGDNGEWTNIVPVKQQSDGNYQWIELDKFDTLKQGSIFAVVVKHNGPNIGEDRIGFWADNTVGVPGWKYYANGRIESGNFGWWVRTFTWDFAVAVDFNDSWVFFTNFTQLKTTASTEPRIVETTLVEKGLSGNEKLLNVYVCFSYNNSEFNCIPMDSIGSNRYRGKIPGQIGVTGITYFFKAIYTNGKEWQSGYFGYTIFKPVNKELLIIFNGGTESRAEQLAPFYVQGMIDNYDLWAAYGPVESEMLNFYDRVLEIHSEFGGEDDNREALSSFASSRKRLGVIGQEVLGYLNSYHDSTFLQGDYEYDILGINHSYNDVNYLLTRNYTAPSPLNVIQGTDYGDALAKWLIEKNIDTVWYDPNYVLGADNWMDQFEPRSDIESEVFMIGLNPDGTKRAVGHSFYSINGTKIFFMSVDPLLLNSDSGWVGGSTLSPVAQFLITGCLETSIDDELKPEEFHLSQNYPNPFNPTTIIKYIIPNVEDANFTSSTSTKLTVYDVLGREVTTLVNQKQKPGSYEVKFNASNLGSGVYFYQLKFNDYIQTKKMILLR